MFSYNKVIILFLKEIWILWILIWRKLHYCHMNKILVALLKSSKTYELIKMFCHIKYWHCALYMFNITNITFWSSLVLSYVIKDDDDAPHIVALYISFSIIASTGFMTIKHTWWYTELVPQLCSGMNHWSGVHHCSGINHCSGVHHCSGMHHYSGINHCSGVHHWSGINHCSDMDYLSGQLE